MHYTSKPDLIRCVICLLFFRCEESKVKITMDVKKKEMDLLSNTIAAYAHIKGTYTYISLC